MVWILEITEEITTTVLLFPVLFRTIAQFAGSPFYPSVENKTTYKGKGTHQYSYFCFESQFLPSVPYPALGLPMLLYWVPDLHQQFKTFHSSVF